VQTVKTVLSDGSTLVDEAGTSELPAALTITAHAFQVDPTITLRKLVANAEGQATITFSPFNPIYENNKIVIGFPSEFGTITPTVVAGSLKLDGVVSGSVSASVSGTTVTLTWTDSSHVPGLSSVELILTNVINPAAPTGTELTAVSFYTTLASDVVVDRVDTASDLPSHTFTPALNIVTHPTVQAKGLTDGATAIELSVSAANGEPATDGSYQYQWYKKATGATAYAVITAATLRTYTFDVLSIATDRGDYKCTVTDYTGAGSPTLDSDDAVMLINAAIAVQTPPASQNVSTGTSIAFTVSVNTATGTSPYSYQWYKKLAGASSAYSIIVGATANPYTISTPVIADEGDFACRITDDGQGQSIQSLAGTLGVNDPPTLSFSGTVPVDENSRNGTVIYTVEAVDANPEDTLEYLIVNGDDDHHFYLDKHSGVLTVARDGADELNGLNHEVQDTFTLLIRATDDGDPVQSVENTLTVSVLDKNDQPILFRVSSEGAGMAESAFTADWSESSSAMTWDGRVHGFWGTSVTTATKEYVVTDFPHRAVRIRLRYWALGSAVFDAGISVEGVEVWTANQPAGGCPRPTTTPLQQYLVRNSAREPAAELTSLSSEQICFVDVDITVPHMSDDLIINVNGALSGTGSDAANWGFGRMIVSTDAVFTTAETGDGWGRFDETSTSAVNVGEPISDKAEEPDASHTLTYSMHEASDTEPVGSYFEIDSGTGQLMTRAGVDLNFERHPEYTLVVRATSADDGETLPLFTETDVTIVLTNENDRPSFSLLDQQIWVDEDCVVDRCKVNGIVSDKAHADMQDLRGTAVGTVIGTLNATDEDSTDTLTYEFTAESATPDWISLDSATGAISYTSQQTFDYEGTTTEFPIIVRVTDNHGQTDELTTAIKVRDVNERPVWCCYHTDVRCKSNDFKCTAAVAITTSADEDLCSVVTTDGECPTAYKVPRGVDPVVNFNIEEGLAEGTNIGVVDSTKTLGLDGTTALQHYLFDPDAMQHPNNTIFYSLGGDATGAETNIGNFLAIDNRTGQLSTKVGSGGGLLSVSVVTEGVLRLTVIATDNGVHPYNLSKAMVVTINIENTNDPPVFDCPLSDWCRNSRCKDATGAYQIRDGPDGAGTYTPEEFVAFQASRDTEQCIIRVNENTMASVIGKIRPADAEAVDNPGTNQTLTFKLNGLDGGDFDVVPEWIPNEVVAVTGISGTGRWVGSITLTKNSLDYETQKLYVVEINAIDDGNVGSCVYNETTEVCVLAEETPLGVQSGDGMFIVVVEDIVDVPLLQSLLSRTQNGLATSGNEIVSMYGLQLGQEVLNSLTDQILVRYGQGAQTVFEKQEVVIELNNGASPAGLALTLDPEYHSGLVATFNVGTSIDDLEDLLMDLTDEGTMLVSSFQSTSKTTVIGSTTTIYTWTFEFGMTPGPNITSPTIAWGHNLPQMNVEILGYTLSAGESIAVQTITDGDRGGFKADTETIETCDTESSNTTAFLACRQRNLDRRVFSSSKCTVKMDFTTIDCQTSEGYGVNHLWEIQISGMTSNILGALTFDASIIDGGMGIYTTNYAPPTIIEFSGDGAAEAGALTAGDQQLVLRGTQFGSDGDAAVTRVQYGPNGDEYDAADFNVSKDHTQITCKMVEGIGGNLKWIVSVAGQSSETPTTRYGIPQIDSLSGATAALTDGNQSIKLHGSNFGPTSEYLSSLDIDSMMSVTYGEVDVEDATAFLQSRQYVAESCYVSVAHEEITCRTAAGEGNNLQWQVLVGDQKSVISAVDSSYGAPFINHTSNVYTVASAATDNHYVGPYRATGKTDGQDSVQIVGNNFGNRVAKLTFHGTEIKALVYTNDHLIQFTTPSGYGPGKEISLEVQGQVSNTFYFDYLPPTVISIAHREGAVGGNILLLVAGVNFGSGNWECTEDSETDCVNQEPPIVYFVNIGSGPNSTRVGTCEYSTRAKDGVQYNLQEHRDGTDHTVLYCETTYYSRSDMYVQVGNQTSKAGYEGKSAAIYELSTLLNDKKPRIDSIYAYTPKSDSCMASFYNASRIWTTELDRSKLDPYVGECWDAAAADSAPTLGGLIEIRGTNLGSGGDILMGEFSTPSSTVGVNDDFYPPIKLCEWQVGGQYYTEDTGEAQESSVIWCMVPAGQGTVNVKVSVGYSILTDPTEFVYKMPTIDIVTPLTGPTAGGTRITLTGSNFGLYNQTVNSTSFRNNYAVYDKNRAPRAVAWGKQGRVKFKPKNNREGGQLTGIGDGQDECQIISYTQTQIVCTMPAGAGMHIEVYLEIDTIASISATMVSSMYTAADEPTRSVVGSDPDPADFGPTNWDPTAPFNYEPPIVTSINPQTGPCKPTPTDLITLTGKNFGSRDLGGERTFTFNTIEGIEFKEWTHEKIVFGLREGFGQNVDYQLTVSGLVLEIGERTNSTTFRYDKPVVTKISPNPFDPVADQLTVTGANFGPVDSGVIIEIANFDYGKGSVNSGETIECEKPADKTTVWQADNTLYCKVSADNGQKMSVGPKSLRVKVGTEETKGTENVKGGDDKAQQGGYWNGDTSSNPDPQSFCGNAIYDDKGEPDPGSVLRWKESDFAALSDVFHMNSVSHFRCSRSYSADVGARCDSGEVAPDLVSSCGDGGGPCTWIKQSNLLAQAKDVYTVAKAFIDQKAKMCELKDTREECQSAFTVSDPSGTDIWDPMRTTCQWNPVAEGEAAFPGVCSAYSQEQKVSEEKQCKCAMDERSARKQKAKDECTSTRFGSCNWLVKEADPNSYAQWPGLPPGNCQNAQWDEICAVDSGKDECGNGVDYSYVYEYCKVNRPESTRELPEGALADYKQFRSRGTFGLCNYDNTFEASCAPGKFAKTGGADGTSLGADGTSLVSSCVPCPDNAICLGGYSEPFAEKGYWKTLNTGDGNANLGSSGSTELQWSYVQCTPVAGCGDGNFCVAGYEGERCASCAKMYFRHFVEGTCDACPKSPTLLLLGYFSAVVIVGFGGYKLYRKGPNMAALAIGIDYYQVLSMFSNLDISWPGYVRKTMEYSSIAMGSLDLTSPECTVSVSYTKVRVHCLRVIH
jgi:hypothetical protein